MSRWFDVVVVGGGTAGCVLAARLSEDPRRTVLLIEEGPDPRPTPAVVADLKRQEQLLLETDYVRMFEAERPDGSTFPLLSGRIMGGGSAVNKGVWVRPMRADFDAWARVGGAAWSYDALLPLMRAMEDDPELGEGPLHGIGGPIRLQRDIDLEALADGPGRALLEAAGELGIPECPDLNVPEPYGVCASPYNVRDGVRQSTAVAYLEPARTRPNLTIEAGCRVTRLLLDGSRVTGVEVAGASGSEIISAGRVVLAAGAYHSPQVLMLSGIGPEDELTRLGIPVRHRLDGVGRNHQDHAVVYLTFLGAAGLAESDVMPKVRLITRSRPELPVPDLHVFLRPVVRVAGLPPMLPISLHLLDHRTPGRVTLASTGPEDLPHVRTGLLESPDDVGALVDGIASVRRLVARPALARYYGELATPAPGSDVAEHVRTTFSTYHHGTGTCAMGPASDPRAVVDERLRVHGLDGLSVADASVLPTIPHANTNMAAVLVGEIAARDPGGNA